jgi:hypothetical protein
MLVLGCRSSVRRGGWRLDKWDGGLLSIAASDSRRRGKSLVGRRFEAAKGNGRYFYRAGPRTKTGAQERASGWWVRSRRPARRQRSEGRTGKTGQGKPRAQDTQTACVVAERGGAVGSVGGDEDLIKSFSGNESWSFLPPENREGENGRPAIIIAGAAPAGAAWAFAGLVKSGSWLTGIHPR